MQSFVYEKLVVKHDICVYSCSVFTVLHLRRLKNILLVIFSRHGPFSSGLNKCSSGITSERDPLESFERANCAVVVSLK